MPTNNQSNPSTNATNHDTVELINRKDFLAHAGRSLLGLLSLPAISTISGCGPKREPIAVDLGDLLAAPHKYNGLFIITQGYAIGEKPEVSSHAYSYYDHSTKSTNSIISTTIKQFHKLYASDTLDGPSISTYEFTYLTGTVGDLFQRRSGSVQAGNVVVSGVVGAMRDRPGFVITVESLREVD